MCGCTYRQAHWLETGPGCTCECVLASVDYANVTCDSHRGHSVSPFNDKLPSTLGRGEGRGQADSCEHLPQPEAWVTPSGNSLWIHCICLQEAGVTPILKGRKLQQGKLK